jgi:hypothetical protein
MDPDYILAELRFLNEENCPKNKKFYKSYGKWASLTKEQKDKTTEFYNGLSHGIQVAVSTM